MAAMLAMASEPILQLPRKGKVPRHEKTRPKNPNRLTVKQHVFPVRSIEPFVGQSGCVALFDMVRALVQITGASETRRIHRYFIVLRGPPSKQQAQRYL